MMKYFLMTCLLTLTSCAMFGIGNNPTIQYVDSKKVTIRMADLYPDFRNKSEQRQLVEVTISSDIELITLSLRNGTTLRASIGLCSDEKHIPWLASNSVFLDGKRMRYHMMNNSEPNTEGKNIFHYQLYLNYETLKKRSYKNATLCVEIVGGAYLFSGFKSNKIQLDLMVDEM